MDFRFYLLGTGILLASMVGLVADSSVTNTPPGAVSLPSATNVQPETPAPPQGITKSAPGAQSPNGANGLNLKGNAITKGPNTSRQKPGTHLPPSGAQPDVAASTSRSTSPTPAPPAAQKSGSVLDHYLQELDDTLHLSADEKKDIQTYYLQDGPALQGILNNGAISPLQQARQVADIRDQRDDKIEALLDDPDRRREFFVVEANYRVALTDAAAEGALNPAQPLAPVPTPTETAPGKAEPTPQSNNGTRPTGA